MNTQLEGVIAIIGTLGAYFAVVLVLSVAVETILDTIKQNVWLSRQVAIKPWLSFLDLKKPGISPDQAMRDIAYWVPTRSQAELQIAALNNMARQFGVAFDEVARATDASSAMINDLIALTGMTRQAAEVRQALAHKLYVIRQKYDQSEAERMVRLRRVAAILGMVFALIFRLDTFAFLGPLFAPVVQGWLSQPYMAAVGMVLTGLASSAGSAFWHEQLDRMRAVKESARTLQQISSSETS